MRVLILLLTGAAIAALTASCRQPAGSAGAQVVARMIPGVPTQQFRGDLVDVATMSWDLTPEANEWVLTHGDLASGTQGHYVPASTLLRMERPVSLQASALGRLRVVFGHSFTGGVEILWRRTGEKFSAQRRVSNRVERSSEAILDLHHPGWTGTIEALRLGIWTKAPDLRLERLEGLTLSGDAVAAATARAWSVDLGRDVRPALLAPPGLLLQWEVEVPRRAELRVAVGVDAGARRPTTFTLATGEGSSRRVLAEIVVGGEAAEPGRWHELSTDLTDHGGRSLTLDFLTDRPDGAPELERPVFWADPRIVAASPRRRPNVVLISVDTLRADRLSLYGHDRDTSPRLDAWAGRRAVTFERAVAPAPRTLPSHVSMFTGLDAIRHGVNYFDPAPASLPWAAARLREAGYHTIAITGAGYLTPAFGFHHGFDSFRYWSPPDPTAADREIEHGVRQTLDWLDNRPREPFFLFLHTYEVHTPYRPRSPYFERYDRQEGDPPALPMAESKTRLGQEGGFRYRHWLEVDGREMGPDGFERAQDLYDSGVAHADAWIGRVLERLEAPDLVDDTLVVFTSDHGEALGERGLVSHGYVYDFNLLVPLVMAFPDGAGAGSRIGEQARLVDVTPTILEVAGLEPSIELDGVSLTAAARGETRTVPREAWSYAASANRGLSLRMGDRWKVIVDNSPWPRPRGELEVFRVDRDPHEAVDLGADDSEVRRLVGRIGRRFAEEIPAIRCRFVNPGAQAIAVEVSGSPWLAPIFIKSVDLPRPSLAWSDGHRGILEMPPGSAHTVFFEGFPAVDRRLSLGNPGEAPAVTLPGRFGEKVAAVWSPDGWTAFREPEAGSASLSCRWQGWLPAEETGPADLSPELEEQLRALGYLGH